MVELLVATVMDLLVVDLVVSTTYLRWWCCGHQNHELTLCWIWDVVALGIGRRILDCALME